MAEKEKQFKHYPVDVKVRNFCGKSKLFFLLTLILVVIAIASSFTGVDIALEFKGGTIITYSYFFRTDRFNWNERECTGWRKPRWWQQDIDLVLYFQRRFDG